ncbi:MAG: hypothetical protein NPIRA06_14960 [Nitrospirales bacterium]|nr:MAG: hypothetical protein NPIRA06_14960 [Nitrospirales bacterium]
MGDFVEGVIAIIGLTAGIMVALTALLVGDAPSSGEQQGSYRKSRTICLSDERVSA